MATPTDHTPYFMQSQGGLPDIVPHLIWGYAPAIAHSSYFKPFKITFEPLKDRRQVKFHWPLYYRCSSEIIINDVEVQGHLYPWFHNWLDIWSNYRICPNGKFEMAWQTIFFGLTMSDARLFRLSTAVCGSYRSLTVRQHKHPLMYHTTAGHSISPRPSLFSARRKIESIVNSL